MWKSDELRLPAATQSAFTSIESIGNEIGWPEAKPPKPPY